MVQSLWEWPILPAAGRATTTTTTTTTTTVFVSSLALLNRRKCVVPFAPLCRGNRGERQARPGSSTGGGQTTPDVALCGTQPPAEAWGGTSLTKARYNCLISRSYSADLIAPASLHWEFGNALSAMFKRNHITLVEGQQALNEYQKIPLRFIDVTLSDALSIADQYSLYAYDACFIACARIQSAPLLSIDNGLRSTAQSAGIALL